MKIMLVSSMHALLKCDGISTELSANEWAEVIVNFGAKAVISVMPLDEQQGCVFLPYTFVLSYTKEKAETNSSYAIIQTIDGNAIIFLQAKYMNTNVLSQEINFNKKSLKVLQPLGEKKLVIEEDGNIVYETWLDFAMENMVASIEKKGTTTYLCVQGVGNGRKYYYLASDVASPVVSEEFDEYSESGDEVTMIRYFTDHARHAKITTLVSDADGWKVKERYCAYTEHPLTMPKDSRLKPYIFLDCVRVENYTFAMGLLTTELKKNIQQEQLKDFFGEFDEVLQLPFSANKIILLKRYTPIGVYQFELVEGMINNIVES